ncbi:hypothetical protein J4573_27875 [Actinomadura barringtoniae]|uniref:Malonyl-CoA:ACP transacylase (MAT) domain-containing protein n=1 Tax=Actinomadura barringtoniae TaxID=1427535 RepID=A0A939PE40_9ACTN|nr:hypothetical protein [Actinomadura barringtoniae]MBO2450945.1 hypothetical protein [Actinomadura barringtoniae]
MTSVAIVAVGTCGPGWSRTQELVERLLRGTEPPPPRPHDTGRALAAAVREASGGWTRRSTRSFGQALRSLRERTADEVLVADADPGSGAAVALLLRRERDARTAGDEIIAVLDGGPREPELFPVLVAALGLRHRADFRNGAPATPMLGERRTEACGVTLSAGRPVSWLGSRPPRLHVYSGADRRAVMAAVRHGRRSSAGPARLAVVAQSREQLRRKRGEALRWLGGDGSRPPGVAYRDRPVEGEIAFVYSNGAAGYQGMGRDLMLAFPGLMDGVRRDNGPLEQYMSWVFAESPGPAGLAIGQIIAAGALAVLHSRIAQDVLGIQPNASLGYSSGECTAPVALSIWADCATVADEARRSDLLVREIAGEHRLTRRVWRDLGLQDGGWANHLVVGPTDRIREAVEAETGAFLTVVNSPRSSIIGGHESACARVLERLGRSVQALPLEYDIAVHAPVFEAAKEPWRVLHSHALNGGHVGKRLYSGVRRAAYQPSREGMAEALSELVTGTVDFAGTVEQAWRDGVRVFIEQGPRGLCSGWISQTLGEREHLAVPFDDGGSDSLGAYLQAVAELAAAGVVTSQGLLLEPAPAGRRHDLASVQREFLTQQSAVQQRFLASRSPRHARIEPAQDSPPVRTTTSGEAYDTAAIQAFAEGRLADCFGPAWRIADAHLRTPRLAPEHLTLRGEVVAFDPDSGYLRMELAMAPGPDSLMLEAGLQAMAFYLTAMGFTIARDGWRFEPTPGAPGNLRRGRPPEPQPSKTTVEILVQEVSDDPEPAVYGDIRCSAGGHQVFGADGIGLRLVPDRPLRQWIELGAITIDDEPRTVAATEAGPTGKLSMLNCAWGSLADAFGPAYSIFDESRRGVRLPGPPYLFMDAVTKVSGGQAAREIGTTAESVFVLRPDAWFWSDSGTPVMPFAALMETVLQPCGWLASYAGYPLEDREMLIRNLGGTARVLREVTPDSGELYTTGELMKATKAGGAILLDFAVECRDAADRPVLTADAAFGFFTPDALDRQQGLPTGPEDRARIATPGNRCVAPTLGSRLQMIDRITGYWPDGGAAGLGRLRAEKDVDPREWFFKSHFFEDPVQPGSLGIEAMIQLLRHSMLERGLADGVNSCGERFEAVRTGHEITWTYRGQVLPTSGLVTIDLEVTELGADDSGPFAVADAWLWVDGVRVYEVRALGTRIVAAG